MTDRTHTCLCCCWQIILACFGQKQVNDRHTSAHQAQSRAKFAPGIKYTTGGASKAHWLFLILRTVRKPLVQIRNDCCLASVQIAFDFSLMWDVRLNDYGASQLGLSSLSSCLFSFLGMHIESHARVRPSGTQRWSRSICVLILID
jgi:hypothetical protein